MNLQRGLVGKLVKSYGDGFILYLDCLAKTIEIKYDNCLCLNKICSNLNPLIKQLFVVIEEVFKYRDNSNSSKYHLYHAEELLNASIVELNNNAQLYPNKNIVIVELQKAIANLKYYLPEPPGTRMLGLHFLKHIGSAILTLGGI